MASSQEVALTRSTSTVTWESACNQAHPTAYRCQVQIQASFRRCKMLRLAQNLPASARALNPFGPHSEPGPFTGYAQGACMILGAATLFSLAGLIIRHPWAILF